MNKSDLKKIRSEMNKCSRLIEDQKARIKNCEYLNRVLGSSPKRDWVIEIETKALNKSFKEFHDLISKYSIARMQEGSKMKIKEFIDNDFTIGDFKLVNDDGGSFEKKFENLNESIENCTQAIASNRIAIKAKMEFKKAIKTGEFFEVYDTLLKKAELEALDENIKLLRMANKRARELKTECYAKKKELEVALSSAKKAKKVFSRLARLAPGAIVNFDGSDFIVTDTQARFVIYRHFI